MKIFHFPVTIVGLGDNVDEAWTDAVNGFCQEPGAVPEDYDEDEDDE